MKKKKTVRQKKKVGELLKLTSGSVLAVSSTYVVYQSVLPIVPHHQSSSYVDKLDTFWCDQGFT